MCGIFGVAFLKGHNVHNKRTVTALCRSLFKKVEARGKKASGVALVNPRQVKVLKGPLPGSTLIETPEFIKLMDDHLKVSKAALETERTTFILGHCRLDTKGLPEYNDNNHPIVVKHTIGVHNGIISNDDEIYEEFKYTTHFPKRIAEVDSEALFALIEYYHREFNYTLLRAIQKTALEVTGSFACATLNTKNPYLLGLFRNSSPVHILHLERAGLIVFASERAMAEHAIKEASLGDAAPIFMDPHKITLIDVNKNNYSIHPLLAEASATGGNPYVYTY